ncbi:MAG: N-acetyltransferase [Betaproteobacteria bacterium]|nr:MAG: N-acetyltransferase [Betaproteobacteria bacterium]
MGDFTAAHLGERRTLADGRQVTIRPIQPEDEAAERRFFARLSAETRRLRFMKFVRALNEQLVHTFTRVDYDRYMAFVCEATVGGAQEIVGEARYAAEADGESCEFSIVIADEWHKSGIGGLLMNALMRYAKASGFKTMEGMVLRDNRPMVKFVRALGFEIAPLPQEPTLVRVVRRL